MGRRGEAMIKIVEEMVCSVCKSTHTSISSISGQVTDSNVADSRRCDDVVLSAPERRVKGCKLRQFSSQTPRYRNRHASNKPGSSPQIRAGPCSWKRMKCTYSVQQLEGPCVNNARLQPKRFLANGMMLRGETNREPHSK